MDRNREVEKKPERIKWSPRIRPEKIERLYQSDAQGFQDDELCNDVGFRLYLRCQTIVMVSRDQVTCPRCGMDFVIETSNKDTVTICPTKCCGWGTTMQAYRQSWRKKRIWGARAVPVFEAYYDQFSPALPYKEKMVLIDRLIHSFHWSLEEDQPNRSAANNLIEGNHDQVVAFLDRLTGVDNKRKEAWRETKERMMRRRKGK
jgi:hypothetical protein